MKKRGYGRMKDAGGRCADCPCEAAPEPENPLEAVLDGMNWECDTFLIQAAQVAPMGFIYDKSNDVVKQIEGDIIDDPIVRGVVSRVENAQIIRWLQKDELLETHIDETFRFTYYFLTRRGMDEACYRLWDRLHAAQRDECDG